MTNHIKQIIKKIAKSGFFHSITIRDNRITFKNVDNVLFCFDPLPDPEIPNLGIFHAGYVSTWQEQKPTFESEYNYFRHGGMCARYSHFYMQETDNPDFILRASLSITLN
jgi:hypothetical protein